MAQGDLIVTCGHQIEENELLAMVTVRHDDGRVGIRSQTISVSASALNPYKDCNQPGPITDRKQWLSEIIREDACGEPAITFFTCS